ncbi:hypothetical protein ACK2M2_13685, partial [Acinetobacter sp. TY1]|uniref:hypothetical protein n=1 Tax=Acinetobacter sp. TY1 TaxID=3387626 RepID=UPI003AF45CCE
FVCRLLHLKIISLKKPLQIGLCNKASSSLSVKGGNNNEITPKIPLIDSNKWFHDVKALVTQSNPLLTTNFNRSISIARNITYDYDFSFNSFVANFLDFRNLHKQKAQTSIFKMQMLSKNIDIKMKNIILQMPTKIDLNTMSSQNIEVLHERVTIFSSFLLEHDVELLKVETAEQASKKILRIAS